MKSEVQEVPAAIQRFSAVCSSPRRQRRRLRFLQSYNHNNNRQRLTHWSFQVRPSLRQSEAKTMIDLVQLFIYHPSRLPLQPLCRHSNNRPLRSSIVLSTCTCRTCLVIGITKVSRVFSTTAIRVSLQLLLVV